MVKETSKPNAMANTILCTINLPESSKEAVQWAVTMAQQLKVHLTILYTYRLIQSQAGEVVQLKKRIEEDAYKQFLDIEKELLIGRGISYDFRTEIGFIADRIEDHAKKNNLNFLVIDKNVSSRSKETFEELMEHIQVPTLVIP
jgi:nucleotide-binding universal stress UspA family protein